MTASPVLDVIERLLTTAQHPDITAISRYGPGQGPWGPNVQQSKVAAVTGVKVTHQSTSTASLWEAVWPGGTPVDPTAVPLPMTMRGPRLAVLVCRLLDHYRPAELQGWQLMGLPGVGPVDRPDVPYGIGVTAADGTKTLLRASSTGATVGNEPDEDPFPDWAPSV